MASANVSNLATTTFKNVVKQTAIEAPYINFATMATFKSEPKGGAHWLVPQFGPSSPTQGVDDGVDRSGGNGYTPTDTIVSTFTNPLTVSETIKWKDLATYEPYIPTNLSSRFTKDLMLKQCNQALNVIGLSAYNAGYTSELIGTATEDAVSNDNFAAGFVGAITKLKKAGYNPAECYCVVRPEMFYALRQEQTFANSQYVETGMTDNAKMNGIMSWGGCRILNQGMTLLGTNTSSDSTLDSSAQWDARRAWGVMWHPDALGVYETDPVHGEIVDDEIHQQVLIYVRTVWGCKSLYPAASCAIGNWAN